MIKIVTDSTAYLSEPLIRRYGITVVPLSVDFQGESFPENRDEDYHFFFEKLRYSSGYPTTSQPPAGLFEQVFKKLTGDGAAVIAILISGKLSGTVQSARAAAAMLPDRDIVVLDSMLTVTSMQFLVLQAAEMAEAGWAKEEIIRKIDDMKNHSRIFFLVHTLEFLRRGGRIGGAAAILGNLLQLKPILHLQDGSIELFNKVRTWDKAKSRILGEAENWLRLYEGKTVRMGLLHVDNPNDAVFMKKTLAEIRPEITTDLYSIGPVIGSHIGPGCIGVAMTYTE